MVGIYRPTIAEINLSNLRHNIQTIRRVYGPDHFLCPMIKANAYGHGDIEVSRCLVNEGVKYLGACLLEEALHLRHHGIQAPILVFQPFLKEGIELAVQHQLEVVVATWPFLEELVLNVKSPVKIHLKFDTGMNRFGFSKGEVTKLIDYVKRNSFLQLVGVATHFVQGEDLGSSDSRTQKQIEIFEDIQRQFGTNTLIFHSYNSGAICRSLRGDAPKAKFGLRPGLMIYGYDPSQPTQINNSFNLKPVMTFKSVISHFRVLQKNETVSYNGTWSAQRESLIGVIQLGYGDGLRRQFSNGTPILVNGLRAPIIGIICMDSLMVDLTEIKSQIDGVPTNNEVIFWGESKNGTLLSAAERAQQLKTNTWEILTNPSSRVPRVFIDKENSR